uniref:Uncharacterized protein n=1 Tax=Anguilla anguilla TaxID=7936 RepID=A0A0E9UFG4_ANGAN
MWSPLSDVGYTATPGGHCRPYDWEFGNERERETVRSEIQGLKYSISFILCEEGG